MEQLAARRAHNPEVACSSHAPATMAHLTQPEIDKQNSDRATEIVRIVANALYDGQFETLSSRERLMIYRIATALIATTPCSCTTEDNPAAIAFPPNTQGCQKHNRHGRHKT